VIILDGIFDGDDPILLGRVDVVEEAVERGGLARSGDAGKENEAAPFVAELGESVDGDRNDLR
jgi:hypothetical protein